MCNTSTNEEEDYLTAASKLPLLNNTLTFTDYLSKDEKDKIIQSPLPGVSTMDMIGNTIMLTFNGNIYVGQIGKVIQVQYIYVS